MKRKQPIGIFDSGIGGTTIFKEIHQLLPKEDIIYLADSKNAPYGLKSPEEIRELCIKNVDYLLSKACKIIVVACNTATTNAINFLREHYPIPFIGIEPAIKPAALNTTKNYIGILATKGTLSSHLFAKTSKEFTRGISTIEVEGNGLVEAIENGNLNSPETFQLLKKILEPILEKVGEIDYVVLGCTHYPYLIPLLKKLLPKSVKIIDSGAAVARQTQGILQAEGKLVKGNKSGNCSFFTNRDPEVLAQFVEGLGPVAYLNF